MDHINFINKTLEIMKLTHRFAEKLPEKVFMNSIVGYEADLIRVKTETFLKKYPDLITILGQENEEGNVKESLFSLNDIKTLKESIGKNINEQKSLISEMEKAIKEANVELENNIEVLSKLNIYSEDLLKEDEGQ